MTPGVGLGLGLRHGLVLGASEVPDGTYFYIIDLGNGEKPLKGYITVHR